MGESLARLFYGELEGLGSKKVQLKFNSTIADQNYMVNVDIDDHNAGIVYLVNWLNKQKGYDRTKAIGHRIVQGLQHTEPVKITQELRNELSDISIYDPEHLIGELKMIAMFEKLDPALTQIACFDTSFHSAMPHVAKMLPIPRKYFAKGIKKYGFHGLSYAYLMEELDRCEWIGKAKGRIILAHLGNGASLAAVKDGKSIDTSMAFTPTSGLPMGTRSGDLDPGVALYLMKTENLSPEEFNELINHRSGLLGISETHSDMRDLLESAKTDKRAAQAVELFCYQTKKWIGSFAAVLEGIDTLVFTGGIGEHSPEVRQGICEGLQFLGIKLDEEKNGKNEAIISTHDSKVCVHVIPTDEELMIAKFVCEVLDHTLKN
jgi:acetate kinase